MGSRLKGQPIEALPAIQKDIDKLKLQVDTLCDNDLPNLGAASPDRQSVYKKAGKLKNEVSTLIERLDGVNLETENLSTVQFKKKTTIERKRLGSMNQRLSNITEQLEPDEVEEDYFRSIHGDRTPVIRGQVDTEDEEDTEERVFNEEDEEEEEEARVIHHVQALSDFNAEEPDDLSFQKGDVLEILSASEDGWWEGRNQAGDTGVVPSTLVRIMDAVEVRRMQSKKDPANARLAAKASTLSTRSGKELWQSLRKSTVSNQTNMFDVLKAMKAVPSGFRSSTLGSLSKNENHRAKTWVVPKFSASNLNFRDIFWDPINKKLRPRNVKICRTFTLTAAKMVPLPGTGVELLSRHVYMALWDEKKILSNVHLVRAVGVDRDPHTWAFTPKMNNMIPSLFDGDCIARINETENPNISLLIELNYYFVRSSSGEYGELCCGWASLPLFEADGAPIGNRSVELKLNGGTPFEKGVELDPTVSLHTSQNLLQSLVRVNKQPRIALKITAYNKLSKAQYDLLPDTLLTSQRYCRFIGMYREVLANTYCRDDSMYTDMVCDPILAAFPQALDNPDIMDALHIRWEELTKTQLTRSQKRDGSLVNSLFRQCFIEIAYTLLQCADLPSSSPLQDKIVQSRSAFIQNFLQRARSDPIPALLAPGIRFKPFSVNKVSFNVLSDRSRMVLPVSQANLRDVT